MHLVRKLAPGTTMAIFQNLACKLDSYPYPPSVVAVAAVVGFAAAAVVVAVAVVEAA